MMIPSRGLRWSSQAIGIGRRRLETFSTRQFSSVQNASYRSSPLLTNKSASILRTAPRFQIPKSNTLIRNGVGIRFASTSPATIATAASAPEATSAVSSPAASTPETTTTSLDNALDFTSDSLYNIPEHIGYLKSLGLEYGWGPTSGMEWLLEHIHIFAGTPWWVSISITAVVVRAILFKPYINAADNSSRMQAIQHITKPISAQMTQAMKSGDNETAMQLRQELQMINTRAGIKIWRSFVPALQMFAGYGTFLLLRGMAKLPVPGLENGGILWFYNLALPDPYFLLPMATAGVLHWVLRRGGETGNTTMTPEMQKLMMYGFPALSLLFTWWLPAALQLSFFVSGLLSFLQASLFKVPAFRSYFNMHPLDPVPKASGKPPSNYKGEMKVRAAPLTSAELDNAFQEGRKAGLLEKAKRNVLDATKDIRTAGSTVMKRGSDRLDTRRVKQEKESREKYEQRRREEIREERSIKIAEEREAKRAKQMAKYGE